MKERSVTGALKDNFRKSRSRELYGNLSSVQKIWYETSDQFRDFDDALSIYVQTVAKRWNSIADILGTLSNKELAELKGIQPRADYLAKYRLLTVLDRTPRPGDIFVDLDTGEGANFVWSPTTEKKFKIWRSMDVKKRDVRYVLTMSGLTEQYAAGRIDDLDRFDPNNFIKAVAPKLRKIS